MNIKRKLHKNSCLQPISESSRFPFCCSHTWEKPWCRAFPYTPLNHSGWHKVKAFRFEFSDFASSLLSSVRPLNGCYSLVANNTICLAVAEQHFGLCPLFHPMWCAPPMSHRFKPKPQQRQTTFCHSYLKEMKRNWIAISFWSDLDSNLNLISPF